MNQYEVLKKYFGYENFREGQETIIDGILAGRDVLGIMPTGAGKSLCYQIPALMLPGITIVISPLISLMKDQVRILNDAGIHAAYINSSLTEKQIILALNYASKGQYKIIYVAPERLETDSFLSFALNADISMVTVDEAHCISQWGQDFRPSYLNIVKLIERLRTRPVVSAFTATATENVREDISCVLKLNHPITLVTGFNRENLYFGVREVKDKDKVNELVGYINEHQGESGIIYCATRKNVDMVFEKLENRGISVTRYHAGLSAEERKLNQDKFIYDENQIIVATNAFGMGIDKSNVRFVIHYNMPQSMENYYQEAGRAGRDGDRSDCLLLYSGQDVIINRFLIDNKEVRADISYEEQMEIKDRDMTRLRNMTNYCMTKNCLREYILKYFGEQMRCSCGNCSNCLSEYEEIEVTEVCKNIIRCVDEVRGRYGINVIVGTLRGERKAKLTSYGLDNNPYYGVERDKTENQLKQIINELILQEYLYVTQDKYALLKVKSKSDEILNGNRDMKIKISKVESNTTAISNTDQTNVGAKKSRAGMRTSDILTSRGLELLDTLKKLRLNLAKEQGMPPYIVFADKSLIDMCIKLPFTKEEMRAVNGVGENKLVRYGSQFIDAILEFTYGRKEKLFYEEDAESAGKLAGVSRKSSGTGKKKESEKEKFRMTKEVADNIVYSEECLITEFAGQINELIDRDNMKKTSGAAINRKLIEVKLVEDRFVDGRWHKNLLSGAEKFGLMLKEKISEKGNQYYVLMLTETGQKNLVEKMLKEWSNIE